jgi:uncharacterized protein YqeY
MTLDVLQKEMITAMKAGNKLRKETISSLIGAVKKTAIDKLCKDNITEELVNEALLKEKKTMQEMIDTCPAERVETMVEYKTKMEVINEFVPKMLSEKEVLEIVSDILSMTTATNVGAAMKLVMPKLKGKAEGKLINKVVNDYLKAN